MCKIDFIIALLQEKCKKKTKVGYFGCFYFKSLVTALRLALYSMRENPICLANGE